jgi:phage major head subunit gpT-like protein
MTEAWTLLDKRANYILQKTIRMQREAWTLLDGGSQLYALIHEARIKRELILRSIEDDEVYIHDSSHER